MKVNGQLEKLPYVKLGQVTIYQDPTDNFNVVLKLIAIGKSLAQSPPATIPDARRTGARR